jgi:hypothetical protein
MTRFKGLIPESDDNGEELHDRTRKVEDRRLRQEKLRSEEKRKRQAADAKKRRKK